MNYCEIKKTDIANGSGVRVTLFVSDTTARAVFSLTLGTLTTASLSQIPPQTRYLTPSQRAI